MIDKWQKCPSQKDKAHQLPKTLSLIALSRKNKQSCSSAYEERYMKDIERPETIYAKMLIKSLLSLEYCVVLSYLSLKQNIYMLYGAILHYVKFVFLSV